MSAVVNYTGLGHMAVVGISHNITRLPKWPAILGEIFVVLLVYLAIFSLLHGVLECLMK